MTQSVEDGSSADRLVRFSTAERMIHRSIAVLMLTCMATAAVLYNAPIAVSIGHRRIVKLIHITCGFALPVPILLGAVFATYRADLRRLNRFRRSDWTWLRSGKRRDGSIRVGKFNAGQKLNSALSTGAIMVLLGTGSVMYFPNITRLSWRTGSTFVHDWFALAIGLLIIGHIRFAIRDPESRVGMKTGSVSAAWARKQHGEWAAEVASEAAARNGAAEEEADVSGRRADAR